MSRDQSAVGVQHVREYPTHHIMALFCYAVVVYWALPLNETTQGWMILSSLAGMVAGVQITLVATEAA